MAKEISPPLASERAEFEQRWQQATAQLTARMDELRELTHKVAQSQETKSPALKKEISPINAAPASEQADAVKKPIPAAQAPPIRGTLQPLGANNAALPTAAVSEQPTVAQPPPQGAFDAAPLAAINFWSGAEPVPGFTLDCLLGEGTCGAVWKASAPGGIPIALKFVPLTGHSVDRKMHELEIVKKVHHPNLVSIFSTWHSPDWIVIAMELADKTLMDRLEQATEQDLPGIPRDELLEYMRDAAKGIDYLNSLHVQNRDIKPSNLLLVGGAVKIADFGTARSLHGSVTDSRCLGTPAYAAPEYLLNKTSSRSDQYSLAVTYCELRGGRLPFDGSVVEVYQAHLNKPPDLDMLPESEHPAVLKAMSKKPRDRWPNCKSFIEALAAASVASPRPPQRKWWQAFSPHRSQRNSK